MTRAAHRVLMTVPVKEALLHERKKLSKPKAGAFILYLMSSNHSKQFLTETIQDKVR